MIRTVARVGQRAGLLLHLIECVADRLPVPPRAAVSFHLKPALYSKLHGGPEGHAPPSDP